MSVMNWKPATATSGLRFGMSTLLRQFEF